jgi:hypothetical protein
MSEYSPQECNSCGDTYKRIGSHWVQSDCDYPKISEYIAEVITGLLMGDGSLSNREGNPTLVCQCTEVKYLEYLNSIFGDLSSGPPRLHVTGDELLEQNGEFLGATDESEYSDQYRWQTRRNPNLSKFSHWYDGSKNWPNDIYLTPTVLKHWYIGDGNYNYHGTNDYISIGVNNERNNVDKINNMFKRSSLPKPNRWNESIDKVEIVWNKHESKELLDYMGSPICGYEYKWGNTYE